MSRKVNPELPPIPCDPKQPAELRTPPAHPKPRQLAPIQPLLYVGPFRQRNDGPLATLAFAGTLHVIHRAVVVVLPASLDQHAKQRFRGRNIPELNMHPCAATHLLALFPNRCLRAAKPAHGGAKAVAYGTSSAIVSKPARFRANDR